MCELLKPILTEANLRLLETQPVLASEYSRLAALPDEMRTLEEERQMADYLLVHLRGDPPYPLLPGLRRSQELEGLAAWKILEAQHALWLAVGVVLRDNPTVFGHASLEWPLQLPEFLLKNPSCDFSTK